MPYCAKCGTEVQEGTKFCPECGQQIGAAVQQAQQPGAQPQTAPKKKTKWRRIALFAVISLIGVCVVIFAIGLMAGGTPDEETAVQVEEESGPAQEQLAGTATPAPTNTPRPTATPIPTPTPIPPAPPFDEIRDNYKEMTEAQWKAYRETLDGLWVEWEGWVSNVDKGTILGKYTLLVDMDSPDDVFSVYDVSFSVPEEEALKYNKEQRVRFSGVIGNVGTFLGSMSIRLEDVSVEVTEGAPKVGAIPTMPETPGLGGALVQEGYVLAAMEVEDPTKASSFYDSKEGTRLVAVDLMVGNLSGESIDISPLRATLLDAEGLTHTPELGGREGSQMPLLTLNSGERVQDWITFEIPAEAVPAAVKYEMKTFGGPVLKVGVQLPSEGAGSPAEMPVFERPELPPLGEVVEHGGYSLSGVTVEDPAPTGSMYTPKPDKKVIAVEVILGNVSGEVATTNPLNATLVDTEGFCYGPELGGREDGQLELVDLNVGEKAKGWIAFEVPEGATAESIKYQFSGYPAVTVQAGLTE